VAGLWLHEDDDDIGNITDARVPLPGADGLHDDSVESVAAEQTDHEINVRRDTRTTARRGHASDEHGIVGWPVRHADAIAEQSPAGERTLRIARQDRDRPPRPPDHLDEFPDHGAPAHAAAARDRNNPR